MNWVEQEYSAVKAVEPDPDAWLTCYPAKLHGTNRTIGECDHRWQVRPTFAPLNMRGFFRLPVRTICRICGEEA